MPRTAPTSTRAKKKAEPAADEPVVRFEDVSLAFDDKVVLDKVSFDLFAGHMKIVLGASGAGKSTILRLILGLLKPDSGRIFVRGRQIDTMSEAELMEVRADLGMVFQEGALFDSFTVRENTGYRLFEETNDPIPQIDKRVKEVLRGLGIAEFAERLPPELSGGQRRRVAIARAIAPRPSIVLYDEPTTGLDPILSQSIDAEIIKLRDLEEVTSIMVTHNLRDAFFIATHEAARGSGSEATIEPASQEKLAETEFVVLKDGKVLFEGSVNELRKSSDAYLREFLA